MTKRISYKDVEKYGIDYIYFFYNDTAVQVGKLQMVDLTNRDCLDGKGKSWNEGAFGNCKIFLYNSKVTDALYLVTKHDIEEMEKVPFDYDGNVENLNKFRKEMLDNFSTIIMFRELAE